MGSVHDAAYFRARRRTQGIPERDPFTHPRFVVMGEQLQAMMALPQLDWHPALFGHDIDPRQLAADGDYVVPKMGRIPQMDKCQCGQTHHNRVSGTKPSDYGHGHHVLWFCGQSCKDKWLRQGRPG